MDLSPPTIAGLAGVVLLAYLVQTAAGFGAMIVALTFGGIFFPIPGLVPLLVPVSLFQTIYIATRERGTVNWPLLLRRVFPLMGAGLVVGFLGAAHLGGATLQFAFGVMILVLAVRELSRLLGDGTPSDAPPPSWALHTALLGSGVIHGIYASGGPLLVYAVGRLGMTPAAFRSTLAVVWTVMSLALMAGFTATGRYDASIVPVTGALLLALPAGVFLGDKIHDRLDPHRFALLLWSLLALGALGMLTRLAL